MNLSTGLRLHAAIAAVCPIDGVAIIDAQTGVTRIDFRADADKTQMDAAQAVAAAFDFSDAADADYVVAQAKAAAAANIDKGQTKGGTPTDLVTTSLMLAVLDQVNELRAATKLPAISADELAAQVKQKIAEATKAAAVDAGAVDAIAAELKP